MRSSKKTWVCNEGCKMTKVPCKHLESLLPKEDVYSLLNQKQNYAGKNVDRLQTQVVDQSKEKADFIAKVGDGLMPIEIDILVLRYVYDEPFATIAKELGLIGVEQVIRLHNDSLKKLKERLSQ